MTSGWSSCNAPRWGTLRLALLRGFGPCRTREGSEGSSRGKPGALAALEVVDGEQLAVVKDVLHD